MKEKARGHCTTATSSAKNEITEHGCTFSFREQYGHFANMQGIGSPKEKRAGLCNENL